ncbi:MAG: DivIVA domain-containing protein [Clostridiales bacterium]|nr:DivIVA domain-containing protein [Clostridiales bacterium]
MLTPLDIHQKEFRRSFRGYDVDEVDEFLDQVVRDFEQLLKENAALKEQLEEYREKVEQYKEMEDALRNAILVAQETANEVKAAARKEADLIVREAEAEAERKRKSAEEAVEKAKAALKALERQGLEFRARIRSLLESQVEMLKREDVWRLDVWEEPSLSTDATVDVRRAEEH